ncbi:hypothetical protein HDU97_004789 [Phlyctochytrium planicorne]|nr:hypothetical protein HDU97_004789 [Phlyctochytrium planicorne]
MSRQWATTRIYSNSSISNVCSDTPAVQISRAFNPRCATQCYPFVNSPLSFGCESSDSFNGLDSNTSGVPGFFDLVAAKNRIPYFVYTSYADADCKLFAPNPTTSSAKEGNLEAVRADGTCIPIPNDNPNPAANATTIYLQVNCPAPPATPDLTTSAPGLEDIGGFMTVRKCTDSKCEKCLSPEQGGIGNYNLAPRRSCLPDAMLGLLSRGFVVGECRIPGEGRDLPYPVSANSTQLTPTVPWRPAVMVVSGRPKFDADTASTSTDDDSAATPTATASATISASASPKPKGNAASREKKSGKWLLGTVVAMYLVFVGVFVL